MMIGIRRIVYGKERSRQFKNRVEMRQAVSQSEGQEGSSSRKKGIVNCNDTISKMFIKNVQDVSAKQV